MKATSSAENGVPSDHTTSSRSVHVIDMRSCATPPLSSVGIPAASHGTMSPFSS